MKTLDEMIAVMQAARDGKKVEQLIGGLWQVVANPQWDWQCYDYRIRPEPRRVPLGPEDVPPGSHVRMVRERSETSWWAIWAVSSFGVYFGCLSEQNLFTFEKLVDSYEISRDDGKTWQPCWKESDQ